MNIEPFIAISMVLFSLEIIKSYFTAFCNSSKSNKKLCSLIWILFSIFQFYVMESNAIDPLFVLLTNILFVFLICHFSYYIDVRLNLFLSVILFVAWMLVEVGTNYVLIFVGATTASYGFLVGAAISKIVMYLLIQILKHYRKNNTMSALSFGCWLKIFLVPMVTVYIIHNTYRIIKFEGKHIFFFITIILMLFVNYIIFDIYDSLCSQMEKARKNTIYEQQIELCNKQAVEREIAYQDTRQLRHDLNEYLVHLDAELQAGHIDVAKEKINLMLNRNKLYREDVSKSGNFSIDALINYKYSVGKALNIQMKCHILVPGELPFEGIDLCIIFGNLLDNAIEAVRSLPMDRRRIEVNAVVTKGTLNIVISNYYDGFSKKDANGQFLTKKQDKQNHGLGLNIVRRTVDKYNGELVLDDQNNMFKAMVLLYMDGNPYEDSLFQHVIEKDSELLY